MKKLLLSIFTGAVLSVPVLAQTAPIKQWDKTFGGNLWEEMRSLTHTTDGGVVLGGYTLGGVNLDKTQPAKGGYDYWIIKVGRTGNKIWDKTIGSIDSDRLCSISNTTDGGYILAGTSNGWITGDKTEPTRGGEDYWIVKVDSLGNKQWDKTLGGSGPDIPYCIKQTSDGGYIITGQSGSGISGDKSEVNFGPNLTIDVWVVKLNANGTKQWDKTFGGTGSESSHSIQQTTDGGYILTSWSDSGISGNKTTTNNGGYDAWILKLDQNGLKQWEKNFGGNLGDQASKVIQTIDGGYLIGAGSNSGISADKTQLGNGLTDFWIIKIDASGNKLWDKSIGGSDHESIGNMIQSIDGNFIIAGSSSSGISGDKTEPLIGGFNDLWIVKINPSGNIIWDKTIGGLDVDNIFHGFDQAADGSFFVGSNSRSGIGGHKSEVNRGDYDYWVIRLGATQLGITDDINAEFNLFPNPTTGIVKLELQNQKASHVAVYNSLGQCIFNKAISKNEQLPLQLDLSNSAKGIYTVQVITNGQSLTKKIVLE